MLLGFVGETAHVGSFEIATLPPLHVALGAEQAHAVQPRVSLVPEYTSWRVAYGEPGGQATLPD
jgi:hypothetical protein